MERLRVRWAEVDLQKIVFNGHYLMYADTAVAGYWRALALPYHDTMAHLQGDLYVRKATLEYMGSARYDEQLDVGIRCGRIGNSSMVFETAICRGDQVLVQGELVYVFANPDTMTSLPVPPALRETLTAFEAGEPMVKLSCGDWAACEVEARRLRVQVLVQEQQWPAALEHDGDDARALHVLAYNRFGLAIGSGRMLMDSKDVAQISRLAVLSSVRGAGVGRLLVNQLTTLALQHGRSQMSLQASLSAAGLYTRLGFEPEGAPFEQAGVMHQTMRRTL